MVIGVEKPRKSSKRRLQEKVDKVSKEFQLNAVENIETGYLEENAVARTSFDGMNIGIKFDRHDFFQLPEKQKKKVILHELLHVKQFQNSLGDWLRTSFRASEKFIREFESLKNVDDMEGEVEILVENLMPEINSSSYPHQKERREREIKQKGLNPEEELLEEVKELEREIIRGYSCENNSSSKELTAELDDTYPSYSSSFTMEAVDSYLEEMNFQRY